MSVVREELDEDGFMTLLMVRKNFKRLDADDFILIYKTYVRPHMEYCIQALWTTRRQTNSPTDKLADTPTRRQTNSPTIQLADKPTRRQTNSPTIKLAKKNQLAEIEIVTKIDVRFFGHMDVSFW